MNINKKICEEGLESVRLIYRKVNLGDVQDMYEYASEQETCRFLKWGPYTGTAQAEAFIKEKIRNYENPADILFGIELKETEKLIGVIRLYHITQESAEISYILNARFSGNGYMTEAVKRIIHMCFEKLQLAFVTAYFVEENRSSERVMINSGMKKDTLYEAYDVIKGEKKRLLRYKIERK